MPDFAQLTGLRRQSISWLAIVLIAATGCADRVRPPAKQAEMISNSDVAQIQPAVQAQSFNMREIDTSGQLAGGVYGIENKQWRWTAGDFSVVLATPRGASTRGATLVFTFYLPDVILSRTGPISLTASVNETEVGMKTYGTGGPQRFSAIVPAELLKESPVAVDFHLDGYVPAGILETRELGVIADAVGLESK